MPSGEIVKVQGYEHIALDELVQLPWSADIRHSTLMARAIS